MKENKKYLEVTNLIEPVILVNPQIQVVGKCRITDLTPILNIVSYNWNLQLNKVNDFKVAIKILEDAIRKN